MFINKVHLRDKAHHVNATAKEKLNQSRHDTKFSPIHWLRETSLLTLRDMYWFGSDGSTTLCYMKGSGVRKCVCGKAAYQ